MSTGSKFNWFNLARSKKSGFNHNIITKEDVARHPELAQPKFDRNIITDADVQPTNGGK